MIDQDSIALLFFVVLVITIVLSPPGPGTPRRVKATK
jgi:hypothetical protein